MSALFWIIYYSLAFIYYIYCVTPFYYYPFVVFNYSVYKYIIYYSSFLHFMFYVQKTFSIPLSNNNNNDNHHHQILSMNDNSHHRVIVPRRQTSPQSLCTWPMCVLSLCGCACGCLWWVGGCVQRVRRRVATRWTATVPRLGAVAATIPVCPPCPRTFPPNWSMSWRLQQERMVMIAI